MYRVVRTAVLAAVVVALIAQPVEAAGTAQRLKAKRIAIQRLREQIRVIQSARARIRRGGRLGHPLRASGVLLTCPVSGSTQFVDDFGAPRPGGRTHEGIDLSAPFGRPLVAVQSGRAEQTSSSLGGLGIELYARNGDRFYYAHLSSYENLGRVTAGETIGRAGASGSATGPHLHFEYHPGGGEAVDPFQVLRPVCRGG